MRLLHVRTLEFKEFWGDSIPRYIIASHRWGDDEPTFGTFASHKERKSEGYNKVIGFCDRVKPHPHRVDWLWIDTCCIDKTNSVELAEAINSMFTWYRNAVYCLAYLQDVEGSRLDGFSSSAWFSRGWTLQELLAPSTVLFYDRSWNMVGFKGTIDIGAEKLLRKLHSQITEITGIPDDVLHDVSSAQWLDVKDRLEWAAKRKTTRPEDMAYSLLGIFGVYMAPIYGEGYRHAYRRLLREIKERPDDVVESQAPEQDAFSLHHEQWLFPVREVLYLGIDVVGRGSFDFEQIPQSEFKWQDESDRPYTIVLRENVFTQVFGNGDLGLQIASRSLDPREHNMRAMWRQHSRVMDGIRFRDLPPLSEEPPGRPTSLPTLRQDTTKPHEHPIYLEAPSPQTLRGISTSLEQTGGGTKETEKRVAEPPIRISVKQQKERGVSRLFSRLRR